MRTAPTVLLVSGDARLRASIAADLRRMGCRVLCARTLEQAERYVRNGTTTRFLLVQLDDDAVSHASLRQEMAIRLPDWTVEDVIDGPPPHNDVRLTRVLN